VEEIKNKVALIEDTIRSLPQGKKFDRPAAVILLAPPGAGKFELAEKISHQFGFVHLQADKIQSLLAPKAGFFDNLDHVTDFALEVMIELVGRGCSPVLDRNVNKKGYREKFKLDIEAAGGELIELVIECPDEVNLKNISADNVDIQIGERPGHILDQDYYLYKKSLVEPPIGEVRYHIPCQYNEIDWERLVNFFKLKLGS
jgi:predicted kinase